jgi:3-hydroxybutyryl-CoA dehydratase
VKGREADLKVEGPEKTGPLPNRSRREELVLDGAPPTAYAFTDLLEGDSITSQVSLTPDGLESFIALSGDRAAAHVDSAHAQAMGFRGRIAHGLYTALPFSRLLGMYLPGPNCVIQSLDLKFKKEVYTGETLTYRVSIERLVPSVCAVRLTLSVTRDGGEAVCAGIAQCVFPELR